MKFFKLILALIIILGSSACKKYVDPGSPSIQLSRSAAFSNDATATSAVLALYGQLERSGLLNYMVVYTGLTSDEFALRSTYPLYQDLLNNNIQASSNFTDLFWKALYQEIYWANAVLEGLNLSDKIDDDLKKQLEGEARFIRAYCYFNLVNFFGDVPVVATTDYRLNSVLSRSKVEDVYLMIESDLLIASGLVAKEYKSPKNNNTNERTRVNYYGVSAFRSKVALYQKKWKAAEGFASEVIDQISSYTLLPSLSDVFLKYSKEQILQIQAVAPSNNTSTGSSMILTSAPSNVYLDERILQKFSTEDKRKSEWIGRFTNFAGSFNYAFKYKVKSSPITSEYTSVLRLAELILIRSEARAMQGKVAEAISDLNLIRERAGIQNLTNLSTQDLLDSIGLERRRELFTENANRWFDLKRWNKASTELSVIKGSNWSASDALFPVPFSEIRINRNLVQNPGY